MSSCSSTAAAIRRLTRARGFQQQLADLLIELCAIDTTPNPDVAVMRAAEGRCFTILERELARLSFPGARAERRPINPAIERHRFYSLPHFTRTARRPSGLSAEETYAGRSNLVYLAPGQGTGRGKSIALNAHVDVVAPYFPPRREGGRIFSRGACDDKGSVVMMIGALRALAGVLPGLGGQLRRNLLLMLVVEEETGGNGSLSLAIDRELKRHYDSVLVGECTGLKLHPANRGAVWYRAEIALPGAPLLEVAAAVIAELEKEGAAIRAESRHALFPARPVQTCHGMIGAYGEHPSRICGEVEFELIFSKASGQRAQLLVRDCLEAALAEYTGIYGDKTRVNDAQTGRPLVARHYDLKCSGRRARVTVHGATGHMGAIRERDGAITKMAFLVNQLARSRARLEMAAGGPVRLDLAKPVGDSLVLEGGQGFLPTHEIEEIMSRLQGAAARGARNFLQPAGRLASAEDAVRVTFGKLHNAAFEGDADSSSMRHALAAAKAAGLPDQQPVLGWTVSCDARLFATEHPGMDVLTFGPGELAHAHSDQEQIVVRDLARAAEFLALFLLRQTGSFK